MVVVGGRVAVDRMNDRTENKEPLTDDAIPGHAGSHGQLVPVCQELTHPATSVSPPKATITPNGTDQSDSAGFQWQCGLICAHMLARHTTYRPWQRFRPNTEQVIMYSCTVRMLLLPRSDFPNVELKPGQPQ